MKRVLSGIKPSGEVTLGNYLGAMKRWAEEQTGQENFYFVPNLHALTTARGQADLRQHTLSAVAWLLAMGIDPKKSVIFVQSQIPVHSEMTWILNNFVTMGELARMTQFKDKSHKASSEGQLVGLFDYPVLMAADILLYDADEVPVGEDQVQHVELTRDIAKRFNNLYGQTFKLPKATLQKTGARIMNLQYPERKMDKSDKDLSGVILLADDLSVIDRKMKRAITDSGNEVKVSSGKPAISNLITIFSLITGRTIESIEHEYGDLGYAHFKLDLAKAVVDAIKPLQEKYQKLMANEKELLGVIEAGNAKAEAIASTKLEQVKQKLGLL